MTKQEWPAAARNTRPIGDALVDLLPGDGVVLEVASGTGQHVAALGARFPHLTWQPSDLVDDNFASIQAWSRDLGATNVLPPIVLDATADSWAVGTVHAIFNANMVHIAPWEACLGLLAGAARVLQSSGALIVYGPYLRGVERDAPSNLRFDESLRARNPSWGIRRLADVAEQAEVAGLELESVTEMPANNLTLVFRR